MHDIVTKFYFSLLEAYLFGYFKKNNQKLYKEIISYRINESVDKYLLLFSLMVDASENKHKIKLYYFKRKGVLPRVQSVIGILQNLHPKTLLDIGTGRGVFLWPLLDQFPNLKIDCVDLLERRVQLINYVRDGGFPNINAHLMDVTSLNFNDNQFEVSTALEVLEHIPNYKEAIKEIVRVTEKFLIISVPSKGDNNPEHVRVFKQSEFVSEFKKYGITNIKFEYVLNHMMIVVNLTEKIVDKENT